MSSGDSHSHAWTRLWSSEYKRYCWYSYDGNGVPTWKWTDPDRTQIQASYQDWLSSSASRVPTHTSPRGNGKNDESETERPSPALSSPALKRTLGTKMENVSLLSLSEPSPSGARINNESEPLRELPSSVLPTGMEEDEPGALLKMLAVSPPTPQRSLDIQVNEESEAPPNMPASSPRTRKRSSSTQTNEGDAISSPETSASQQNPRKRARHQPPSLEVLQNIWDHNLWDLDAFVKHHSRPADAAAASAKSREAPRSSLVPAELPTAKQVLQAVANMNEWDGLPTKEEIEAFQPVWAQFCEAMKKKADLKENMAAVEEELSRLTVIAAALSSSPIYTQQQIAYEEQTANGEQKE